MGISHIEMCELVTLPWTTMSSSYNFCDTYKPPIINQEKKKMFNFLKKEKEWNERDAYAECRVYDIEENAKQLKVLGRQVRCGAKGHSLKIDRIVNSLSGAWYEFCCTECGLEVRKYIKDLTPKEKTALKALKVL